MAKVKDGGQGRFEDKPLIVAGLEDHIETILETKQAVASNRAANAKVKEALPAVSEPTRFVIGERFFIEVTPYSVDGHEVGGGERRRVRVLEMHEATK